MTEFTLSRSRWMFFVWCGRVRSGRPGHPGYEPPSREMQALSTLAEVTGVVGVGVVRWRAVLMRARWIFDEGFHCDALESRSPAAGLWPNDGVESSCRSQSKDTVRLLNCRIDARQCCKFKFYVRRFTDFRLHKANFKMQLWTELSRVNRNRN